MVKHLAYEAGGRGSIPRSNESYEYGIIVGSSPTCSTKQFIDVLDKIKRKSGQLVVERS